MTSFIDTATGRLAYDERGPGPAEAAPGETVVMLPSGGHDRHDYDELRALLPGRLRTIAIDWPAHGDSPAGSGGGSVTRLAAVAEQAVAQLAPGGAVVLGNSVGGFAAARMAIRRPDLVRGLAIVDGGGFQPHTPLVRLFCSLMARPRFLHAIYPAFSARYMRVRTAADRRARAAAVRTTREDPGLRAIAELWRSFVSPDHDLRAQAPSIAVPTLIVWGRHDPVIPLRVAHRIENLIEGSRLVTLDTGHVPHTSDPGRFAAELLAFLRSLGAGAAAAASTGPGAGAGAGKATAAAAADGLLRGAA